MTEIKTVLKKEHHTVRFVGLNIGDCFVLGENAYYKIDRLYENGTNAICINSGELRCIEPFEEVVRAHVVCGGYEK